MSFSALLEAAWCIYCWCKRMNIFRLPLTALFHSVLSDFFNCRWELQFMSNKAQRACAAVSYPHIIFVTGSTWCRKCFIEDLKSILATIIDRSILTWLLGKANFVPKNVQFWLCNLQILSLLWPVNFLRLQLQNNSALGVELTQKHVHALYASKFKKNWLFNFRDDILISTLTTTVESNLRTS